MFPLEGRWSPELLTEQLSQPYWVHQHGIIMEIGLFVIFFARMSWNIKSPVDTRNLNLTGNDCEERSNSLIVL
jgi:hypothetical protein